MLDYTNAEDSKLIAAFMNSPEEHSYFLSYELIFPVLIKIESLGHKWSAGVSSYPYHFCHIGDIKIEAVSALDAIVGACVEFIKNYNSKEKQFVTYEIALALKELEFDEECLAWYAHEKCFSSDYIFLQYREDLEFAFAPLWQQAIDWLREKKKIHIGISLYYDGYSIDVRNFNNDTSFCTNGEILEFHKAREQAILKAIELCKNN